MRIANPNNAEQPFYAGKCKNNAAPKHVTSGESKKVKLGGKSATMFDSPKSAEYIYVKQGDNWLYVKDKSIFGLDNLEVVPVTRSAAGEAEASVEA